MTGEPDHAVALMHGQWLEYQSRAQQHWFAGLYQQGFRQQTPEQALAGRNYRNAAWTLERWSADAALLFSTMQQAANSPRHAGPFASK